MYKIQNFKSPERKQSGLSLIEVLIAIVISSIGLLGLAGMQATGLQNNHSAYHRSQATVLAYDIADRMRSNVDAVGNYLSSYQSPPVGIWVSDFVIVDGLYQIVEKWVPGDESAELAGCKTTAGCSLEKMARSDVIAWGGALASTLPSGTGTVTFDGARYTVNIRWDDNRSGGIDDADPTFQMSFRM